MYIRVVRTHALQIYNPSQGYQTETALISYDHTLFQISSFLRYAEKNDRTLSYIYIYMYTLVRSLSRKMKQQRSLALEFDVRAPARSLEVDLLLQFFSLSLLLRHTQIRSRSDARAYVSTSPRAAAARALLA